MIKYLRAYYSIKHKDIAPLALDAWRTYIKGESRIYNMNVCVRFQQAFIHAYRHKQAKAKLADSK